MRLFRLTGFPTLAAYVCLSLTACGETTGPEGEAQNFSGSYTLHSIAQGTVSNVTVLPGATGTFTMTATTYEVTIDTPLLPNPIVDTGTYTATGTATSGTFSQTSTSGANLQYEGTYAWDAATNRLTLDTTSGNTRTVLVIQKT